MEDQVSHISELEGLNLELDGLLSDLKGREETSVFKIHDLEAQLDAARSMAESAAARLAAQEAALSGALQEAKTSLINEISKSASLASEREDLAARLESVSRLLDEERARSTEKDLFIKSSRSALKDKDAESEKIWQAMEELKAEAAAERVALKDREAQLVKFAKVQENLEQRLAQAARDSARSEEGFLLKVDLIKKELKDQVSRSEELERIVAAAGKRLDEALEEIAHKEALLATSRAAVAEKEALLKTAGLKIRELSREAEGLRGGSRREKAELGRELAASLSARVEELEAALAENAAENMERFRKSQAALSDSQAALRNKEEENASLRAREESILRQVEDAEEKWKLSAVQLHNSVSKLRAAENENEISAGRIKTLEAERDKFRAAAMKAEATASSLASQESQARDGEAAGLMAALEEQAAKYTDLLRKYDGLRLANESISLDKAGALAETEALRARLASVEAGTSGSAEAERVRGAQLFERARAAEAALKKKGIELEEALAAKTSLEEEVAELRARLQAVESNAAGAAQEEKARYARLSERMQNADALLKKKEFELGEARAALSGIENECEMLRASRVALGQKYAAEIQAENEMIQQAQARVVEQDSVISRLSSAEEELRKEAEALKREKKGLQDLVRKKSLPQNAEKISETERLLAEKESRLLELRLELQKTKAEKEDLEVTEGTLREELKAKPYRAMLRESEDRLLIKEKMLAELNARMRKLGGDFEELKKRGQSSGGPGYIPDFEELVAGVAHQIANSISIIRSHAEFCAESPEADGAKESLSVIVRNIVGLQKKIDTIMNFSRPVIPQRSPENLDAIAGETLQALRASGRLDKIKTSVKVSGELNPINVDRVRLAAAIEQLLLNAAEAMPGGGEIRIKLSSSGGRQRLEVIDTGEGVEKKNLGAVFHPFFTTRPGKMGLGLTLARNVARAHGGTLELAGDPGRGARAVMELPEA
jgi:nitrogen-specific signal transduction histidine kinase